MLSSRARSSGLASQATISPPRASSISRHSATKSAIRSSIGGRAPSNRLQGPLCRQGVNGPLSVSRQRHTYQQHFVGGIAELDRPARFGRKTMCEPGTGGPWFDRSVRMALGDGLAKCGVEQDAGALRPDYHFDGAVTMFGADVEPPAANQRIPRNHGQVEQQLDRALGQFVVGHDPAKLDPLVGAVEAFDRRFGLTRIDFVAEAARRAKRQAEELELVGARLRAFR